MKFTKFVTFLMFSALLGCDKQEPFVEPQPSVTAPVSKPVIPAITEASGIADSKVNPGNLWVHEDGGNPAELHLLSHDGNASKTLFLKGAANRDWEDMVLSGNDLYIADIGDNSGVNAANFIYKFREPKATADTVSTIETIKFKYQDGPHDAEAFLIDPSGNHIYIITKRDTPSRIYKLNYPYNLNAINTAELVGSLTYSGVVSATLSSDGKGIIVKTYASLFYYPLDKASGIEQALQKEYTILPYKLEPQGEAVTFSVNNTGYFTLSEKALTQELKLNFYKMK